MINATDAQAVIDRARAGDAPENWAVWRLRRDFVLRGLLGWGFVAIVGFALLVPIIITTVPGNFEHGGGEFLLSGLLLFAFAAMAFGGLGIFSHDLWRLLHADDYLLVMTPNDYVKTEPRSKITHVPMDQIAHVTLRGVKVDEVQIERPGHLVQTMAKRFQREPKSAPSLAFIDRRTDKEVVVATDESFDKLAALEEILMIQIYAKEKENERSRTG